MTPVEISWLPADFQPAVIAATSDLFVNPPELQFFGIGPDIYKDFANAPFDEKPAFK